MPVSDSDVKTLMMLGINSTQAKIFLTLTTAGTSTIKKISELSGIARPDTYRALLELQELALVEKILSTPSEYTSSPLSDAVSILIGRREKENIELDEKLKSLLHDYAKLQPAQKQEKENNFVLVPNGAASLTKIAKLIRNTQKSITIMATQQVITSFLEENSENLKEVLGKKLKIKITTGQSTNKKLQKIIEKVQKKTNMEIRYLPVLPYVSFLIFDEKEILLTTTKTATENSFAVWSNNSSLVELSQNYFDAAWFSAVEPPNQSFKRDKRQFDYLFDNMPIGFVYSKMIYDDEKNVDYVLLQVNDAFEKITRLPKEKVLGQKASVIMPRLMQNYPEVLDAYKKISKTNENIKFEVFLNILDVWLSVTVYSPERGYVVILFEDVTERKKAEQKGKEEKEKAEQYLNIVAHAIVVLDNEGKIKLLNKKGCEILGYKENELIGKNWIDICIPEENKTEVTTVLNEYLEKQKIPPIHENPILTKDGKKRILRWHNVELKDGEGHLIGIIGSGEDVTDSKHAN
jgi:PAS domain S-box-containing protein